MKLLIVQFFIFPSLTYQWCVLIFNYYYCCSIERFTHQIHLFYAFGEDSDKMSVVYKIKVACASIIIYYHAVLTVSVGHYFFFTINRINKEKWFNEFLATYFLICYIREKSLNTNLESILKPDYSVARHKTLEDFQKLYLGVGPANYGWYQCQFAQLGFAIYPQLKMKVIEAALENYGPGGKNLDGVSLLKTLAPDIMNNWLKEMK